MKYGLESMHRSISSWRDVNRRWRQRSDRRREFFERRLHSEWLDARYLLAVITVDTELFSEVTLSGLTLTGGDVDYGGAIHAIEKINVTSSTISGTQKDVPWFALSDILQEPQGKTLERESNCHSKRRP